MNPTVRTRRHMARLAALRTGKPGPKPARTFEMIKSDPRSQKWLRKLQREVSASEMSNAGREVSP